MPSIVGQPTLADLLIEQSETDILNASLAIAQELNLPVTAWQPGDPTRSLYIVESKLMAALEQVVIGFIQSGFLDFAQGEWLIIQALEQFGVVIPPATFATTNVVLTNSGGGIYIIEPQDLTFKNTSTGATYHNTTGGTLTGVGTSGATLTLTVAADLPGSASSASAHEIALVTNLTGVTVDNANPAVGLDQLPRAAIIQQCRDASAALSPNGPAAAYSFVARDSTLTGISTVTRARVYDDSTTGNVTIYVAGPLGDISSGDVAAVQAAILKYATPLCITPTTISATARAINVTYQIWLYQSVGQTPTQIAAAISDALVTYIQERPIGGDTGFIYASELQAVIGTVFPNSTFRVQMTVPSSDTAMGAGDVAIPGTITPTAVNLIPDPI
jgi:hypothetical protein